MRICLLVLFFFAFPFFATAQPGDPGGNPTVPITGIEILLAAGGLLGIKRLISNKKNK